VSRPNYSLIPSVRSDPGGGEPLFVNAFGPGAGLTALPIFSLVQLTVGNLGDRPRLLWFTAKSVASLLVATSAAFIYLASRRFLEPSLAALIALSYGLGTCVWSTSTQTLWQHAPNEFFLALGSYAFFLTTRTVPAGGRQRCAAAACAAAFACATVCRPTSAIVLAAIGVYIAATDRRAFAIYVLAALPIALALGTYNAYFLGSPWNFGQAEIGRKLALAKTGSADLWQTPLWLGMAGLLVSPSRGLLVFSPFLVFSLPGIYRTWRRREFALLRPLTVALGLILGIEAKHFDWWGGWSYGYRHIVDTTVFLALLLIPVAGWLAQRPALGVGKIEASRLSRGVRKSPRRFAATPFAEGGAESPTLVKGAASEASGGFAAAPASVCTRAHRSYFWIEALVRRRWRLAAYAVLLAWSVVVQIAGAFAYDGYGWNARRAGFELRLPDQPQPRVVESEAEVRSLVATRGARLLGEVRLDIDQPQHRYRLWSLWDNQIAYYLSHFAESRRTKLDAVAHFGE